MFKLKARLSEVWMSVRGVTTDRNGAAVRWFSYAAAALTVTAAVGTYGMVWLVGAERQSRSAFLPLGRPTVAVGFAKNADPNPTASIEDRTPIARR